MIPFLDVGSPNRDVADQLAEAYQRVAASGYYVLGPELEAFETELADAEGVTQSIGVGTGLDALALALRASGIGAGDEVIVPSNTFIATWLAVSQIGAIPVPVEPRDDTCNLDPDRITAAITPRTSAIVPVHLYGQPADMTPIRQIADSHSLALIADGAQSVGATYSGRPVAEYADATALSFYPGKNLGALGDAGAVLTSDEDLANEIRRLRNYGSTVKYFHDTPGTNSRLDELQAAFLRAKLPMLPQWNQRRTQIADHYATGLADQDLRLVTQTPASQSAWHLYVIRHPQRDQLQQLLTEHGIQTLIHYPRPPHLQAAYPQFHDADLPIAARQAQQVLSLPIGPHLTNQQADEVIAAVGVSLGNC